MPIYVFGSLNHDLVTHTTKFPGPGETVSGASFQYHLGGKGFNEAVACAKLKSPSDRFSTKLVGCLGDVDNQINSKFIAYLDNLNIKTDNIKIIPNINTGTATIIVQDDKNGENRIIVVPGANDYVNPSLEELTVMFKDSNQSELHTSIVNPELPSHLHGHSTKPLNNEQMAKTNNTSNHVPSNIHSHGSMASLANINSNGDSLNNNDSSTGLVYKDGSLIHSWSASGTNLVKQANSSTSNFHSHTTKPIIESTTNNNDLLNSNSNTKISRDFLVSKITGSNTDNSEIPSDLHSHASNAKLETLTYPSPKPSVIDLQTNAITMASKAPIPTNQSKTGLRTPSNVNLTAQQRLTNVSFSLGGSSVHSSSSIHLTPSQSYLQMFNSNLKKIDTVVDDFKYIAILQNEIPNPHKIINHLSNTFPNVEIFYNPSPLPNSSLGYNSELLNSLHNSQYVIINEHELTQIVDNYHSSPERDPMTLLKNISNFEPNSHDLQTVNTYVKKLSKLRTILTKPALIVTLGSAGVLFSQSGSFDVAYVPAEDVCDDDVVDTTGAGDTFLGALATCLYRGDTLESAVRFATRASAVCIQRKGAAESMPWYREVENRGWIL